jgi:hypothetical protein
MQFRLWHLIILTTAFCIYLGLVFVSPPILGTSLLMMLYPCAIAVFLVGTLFGDGARRVFFIGGLSGCVTFNLLVFAEIIGVGNSSGIVGLFAEVMSRVMFSFRAFEPAYETEAVLFNVLLSFPWLCGGLAGLLGYLTYRFALGQKPTVLEPRENRSSQ